VAIVTEKVIKYILTDGENYVVNSNGNILAKTKPDAFIWNTKEAAENVKEYSTNKKVKANFYVEEIETYVSDVPGYIEMEMRTVLEFYDIVKDCAESFDSMVEQLSQIDKELSDIDHFIEFTELNARDGYKIYKKLSSMREESLSNKLADGKQNPVGVIAMLNRHYGWASPYTSDSNKNRQRGFSIFPFPKQKFCTPTSSFDITYL
jgi:hypothetical protein